jgi:hypothetical protein
MGHAEIQTTQIYLDADLTLREQALAKAAPIDSKPGRYRPPDAPLAFLEALRLYEPDLRAEAVIGSRRE